MRTSINARISCVEIKKKPPVGLKLCIFILFSRYEWLGCLLKDGCTRKPEISVYFYILTVVQFSST